MQVYAVLLSARPRSGTGELVGRHLAARPGALLDPVAFSPEPEVCDLPVRRPSSASNESIEKPSGSSSSDLRRVEVLLLGRRGQGVDLVLPGSAIGGLTLACPKADGTAASDTISAKAAARPRERLFMRSLSACRES